MKTIFPTREIDNIEKTVLSMGMSLAMVPLVGLILYYSPWGMNLTPVTLSLLILTIILTMVGLIREQKVKKPLRGLKVVPYYGCYLIRPPELTGFDDPENPQTMDRLLQALGAEVLDWRAKVDCCGGSLSLTTREVVTRLVNNIRNAADEVGAEAIVTACGLCHANLESRQVGEKPLPVFYFTELIGLAFGLDARPWLKKHLISPFELLEKHGLLK